MRQLNSTASRVRVILYGVHVSYPDPTRAMWAKMLQDRICEFSYTEMQELAREYVEINGLCEGTGPVVDEQLRMKFRSFLLDRLGDEEWRYGRMKRLPGYVKKGAGIATVKMAIREHHEAAELLAAQEEKARVKRKARRAPA